jgi:hypothetical protein
MDFQIDFLARKVSVRSRKRILSRNSRNGLSLLCFDQYTQVIAYVMNCYIVSVVVLIG